MGTINFMAITPGPGYMIDPNNPNGVVPISQAAVNNPNYTEPNTAGVPAGTPVAPPAQSPITAPTGTGTPAPAAPSGTSGGGYTSTESINGQTVYFNGSGAQTTDPTDYNAAQAAKNAPAPAPTGAGGLQLANSDPRYKGNLAGDVQNTALIPPAGYDGASSVTIGGQLYQLNGGLLIPDPSPVGNNPAAYGIGDISAHVPNATSTGQPSAPGTPTGASTVTPTTAATDSGTPGTGTPTDPSTSQPPVSPTPEAAANIYNDISTQYGLPDIKAEYTSVLQQQSDLQNELAGKIADLNEDPWMSQSVIDRNTQRLNDRYSTKLDILAKQAALYDALYQQGVQQAQFLTTATLNQQNQAAQLSEQQATAAMAAQEKVQAAQQALAIANAQEADKVAIANQTAQTAANNQQNTLSIAEMNNQKAIDIANQQAQTTANAQATTTANNAQTTTTKDYMFAVQNGYSGSFLQYQADVAKKSAATSDPVLTPSQVADLNKQGYNVTYGQTQSQVAAKYAPAPSGYPTANLQPGSTGPQVQQLQQWLVTNGYMSQADMNTGPGTYGPKTTAAVAKLQADRGIDNTGAVGYYGPKTIASLSGAPPPTPPKTTGGSSSTSGSSFTL